MPNPWLRLHTSILDSKKIQTLPDRLFKPWLNSLAIANRHDGILPSLDDYAFEMRLPLEKAKKYRSELVERKLIDEHDGIYTMHDWEFWQFENGTSEKQKSSAAERQKRYREKRNALCSRDVTDRNADRNALRNADRNESDENVTRNGSRARTEQNRTEYTEQNRTDNALRNAVTRNSVTRNAVTQRNATVTECDADQNEFSDTIDRIASRHPKKSGITAGRMRLAQILANAVDPIAAARSADTTHAAFCRSDEWRREGGRYAPKLGTWADSNGFMDPAPTQQEEEVW